MRAHWAFSEDGCLICPVDDSDFGGSATPAQLAPPPSLEEARAKIIEALYAENQQLQDLIIELKASAEHGREPDGAVAPAVSSVTACGVGRLSRWSSKLAAARM